MDQEMPVVERPSWDTVWLVCKACHKRGKGPKKLKPKDLVTALRQGTKGAMQRPRIVLSDCLGLCPKSANAIAFVGGPSPASLVAVKSIADAERSIAWVAAHAPAQPR